MLLARSFGDLFSWHKIVLLIGINWYLKLYFMLKWAAIFFVISIIAAVFGFGGIASGSAEIAKVLFFIFIVLFVLTLIFGAKIFGK